MARGEQLGRQWRIIQSLAGAKYGKSVNELAADLDIHARTVYRDLEALQLAGFPVYTEKTEGRKRWCILDAARHQPPLPLSLTELMALYFSRDMLKVLKHTVLYDSLETLFEKIKTTLPPESLAYLAQMSRAYRISPRPQSGGQGSASQDLLTTLDQAVINRTVVEIGYFAMHNRRLSRRKVAPYKLWFVNDGFYLVGHCYLRNAIRLFAVDRIRDLVDTGEHFEPLSDFDVDAIIDPSFGPFLGEPVLVRIRFSRQVAGYIREKTWHPSQRLIAQDNGDLIFEARVAGLAEIKHWVLGWGAQARIIAPEQLCREIAEEIRHMAAAYDNAL